MSAVGVPDAAKGHAIYAEVVPVAGEQLKASELKQFMRGKLPAYNIPARIRIVKDIPLSPVGKALHRAVQDNFGKRQGAKR